MYTFNLQIVLDHRQFIEDNLKKELAEIKQQVTRARQQLDTMKRKEMDTATVLKEEQSKGLSSDGVIAYHAYLKRLAEQIDRQTSTLGKLVEVESKKQNELLEAMKRRQILEKLKEQGLDRYNRAILKKEMELIDEVAVNRFARKMINANGESE
ncbi:flagellar export protein FliJ [Desulfosarcina widdelii]|uniref:Flagellar FliJ protein n=1 Tax=Desulfosarcina widdelii TaxID=947919 RepID=A0A5K7YYM6_9BACT|nr:flagellar export protein FliJ [Desulfosarcina widdelii]BBO73718.1 flagellar export protein FliJ [Desulfosarcina widdelii]